MMFVVCNTILIIKTNIFECNIHMLYSDDASKYKKYIYMYIWSKYVTNVKLKEC